MDHTFDPIKQMKVYLGRMFISSPISYISKINTINNMPNLEFSHVEKQHENHQSILHLIHCQNTSTVITSMAL
jgi:hypothetical protein